MVMVSALMFHMNTEDLVGEAMKWMEPEDLDSNPCSVLQVKQMNDLSSMYLWFFAYQMRLMKVPRSQRVCEDAMT